ncbi:MAG: hypothetical protein NVV70_16785 [Cellulomonas sp.]|nr:hypothetical protein [Cellulomonas sp.]MCR6649702.1 hypothetical protein [Cellulomonas sp.]
MSGLSRRQWADLRFAHPDDDPADPSDRFIEAVLHAAGVDPDGFVSERDLLAAYREVLAGGPDHAWARRLIDADPTIAVEASVCLDMGVSHDEFLSWSERAQDLAIATALKRRDLCPAGRHPRDVMGNAELVQVARVYCAVCDREHELEKRAADAGMPTSGWSVEVTRVGR